VLARCTVANTGRRAGSEVVQLYVGFRHSRVDRPVKLLRGCARVHLAPGRQRSVTLSCPLERLRWYDPAAGRWELEHMPYEVYIGTSSADADLLQGTVTI
jgi:beta-glucosidase